VLRYGDRTVGHRNATKFRPISSDCLRYGFSGHPTFCSFLSPIHGSTHQPLAVARLCITSITRLLCGSLLVFLFSKYIFADPTVVCFTYFHRQCQDSPGMEPWGHSPLPPGLALSQRLLKLCCGAVNIYNSESRENNFRLLYTSLVGIFLARVAGGVTLRAL